VTSFTPIAEVRRSLAKRPEKTRTYRVRSDAFRKVAPKEQKDQRRLNKEEVVELAEYLGVRPTSLKGPFVVPDASCQNCGRHITFLDFVSTGVGLRAHAKGALRDVLTGRSGTWLTIRGLDGGRPIDCFNCGRRVGLDAYCYSSGGYAYA
jgi:hypothetical protein